MTEKELKAVVMGFIERLVVQREKNANFDFFLFFDVDSPSQDHTGSDYVFCNTFNDMEGYQIGMVMIDTAMRDRMSRDNMGFSDSDDIQNNTSLRLQGFDGYLVN